MYLQPKYIIEISRLYRRIMNQLLRTILVLFLSLPIELLFSSGCHLQLLDTHIEVGLEQVDRMSTAKYNETEDYLRRVQTEWH